MCTSSEEDADFKRVVSSFAIAAFKDGSVAIQWALSNAAALRGYAAAATPRRNDFHLHLRFQRREAHGSDFTQVHCKLAPGADH